MKKILKTMIVIACITSITISSSTANPIVKNTVAITAKLDIKIKNDSGDEVTVINSGSGGTYRLQKNITTTIKMDVGDKLYTYENGKKGKLLLTATAEMDSKVQLFSKL
jgi:hypothetical protein